MKDINGNSIAVINSNIYHAPYIIYIYIDDSDDQTLMSFTRFIHVSENGLSEAPWWLVLYHFYMINSTRHYNEL